MNIVDPTSEMMKKIWEKQSEKELKEEREQNIQYVVNRQKIGFSEIPLEAIFNPTIDKIKSYERK